MGWLAVALSGCTPAAQEALPRFVAEPAEPAAVPEPPAPPRLPPDPAAPISPKKLEEGVSRARQAASDYVAWPFSRTDKIQALTRLTRDLNLAVARLQAGKSHGRYRPADLTMARESLARLQTFLAQEDSEPWTPSRPLPAPSGAKPEGAAP